MEAPGQVAAAVRSGGALLLEVKLPPTGTLLLLQSLCACAGIAWPAAVLHRCFLAV